MLNGTPPGTEHKDTQLQEVVFSSLFQVQTSVSLIILEKSCLGEIFKSVLKHINSMNDLL